MARMHLLQDQGFLFGLTAFSIMILGILFSGQRVCSAWDRIQPGPQLYSFSCLEWCPGNKDRNVYVCVVVVGAL